SRGRARGHPDAQPRRQDQRVRRAMAIDGMRQDPERQAGDYTPCAVRCPRPPPPSSGIAGEAPIETQNTFHAGETAALASVSTAATLAVTFFVRARPRSS